MKKQRQFAKPEGIIGRITCRLMNIGNQALYKSVIASLPKNKKASILDIGYGNGAVMKRLFQLGYSNINGIEISDTMHDLAQKNFAKEIAQHILQLFKGKVETMPLPNDSMDYVYSINTIYFWDSLEVGLKEIYQIMKPQGRIAIAFYDKHFLRALPYTRSGFKFYDNDEILETLKRNGFIIKKIIQKKHGLALCYVCEVEKA